MAEVDGLAEPSFRQTLAAGHRAALPRATRRGPAAQQAPVLKLRESPPRFGAGRLCDTAAWLERRGLCSLFQDGE
jgi:hypothetical protein